VVKGCVFLVEAKHGGGDVLLMVNERIVIIRTWNLQLMHVLPKLFANVARCIAPWSHVVSESW
jgi:hypothetical protein